MSRSIVLIAAFMGPLPPSFDVWRASCHRQSDIDFILLTDQPDVPSSGNVAVVQTSLAEIADLASRKLRHAVNLSKPYKLCDLRPMYGVVFDDLIGSHAFWGHCDIDLVFGSIRSFVTDDVLDRHDKVYEQGHLTLYRHTEECNNRFRLGGQENWEDVVTSPCSFAFDEYGMARRYRQYGLPVYLQNDVADIVHGRKRYTLSNFSIHGDLPPRPDYHHQVFYWERGQVFRAYVDGDRVETDTFACIHLQKRRMAAPPFDVTAADSFYISDDRFQAKSPGTPTLQEVLNRNRYRGTVLEYVDRGRRSLRRFVRRVDKRARAWLGGPCP